MTLLQQLEELFHMVLGDDSIEITPETTAADLPNWDSLRHINLMFSVEEVFGVQFKGNEFAEFENVGALIAFLEESSRGRR